MTTETAAPQPQKLENVMGWLTNVDAATPAPADPEIDKQANSVVTNLLSTQPGDGNTISHNRQVLESMGAELQKEAARRSQMLKQPVTKLYKEAEGGEVGNALINLKMKVEELDPGKFDFEAGWATRAMGMLPFVGSPLKRYFTRYENASTVMDAIIRSLRQGREQLGRDNITLADDQKAMRALTEKLDKAIKLGQMIDAKLTSQLERELTPGDPRHTFVQSEWLFPLRQRIQDLQQQMVVNQQGVLAIEMIIRNNVELARGVDRAINVTVSALQVAVTLALALANQKIVLGKIQAVNETTDKLIADTAKNLRQQGAEINKMAAGTTINIDTLKAAFVDINAAIEDVTKFRQDALPQMAAAIVELDKLSAEAGKAITNMENAKRVSATLNKELNLSGGEKS
jgi:uncharacterized protein YaaN involved in tellurite resistance